MIINFNITGKEDQEKLIDVGCQVSYDFQDEINSLSNPAAINAQMYAYSVLGKNLLVSYIVNVILNRYEDDYTLAEIEAAKLCDDMARITKESVIHFIRAAEKGDTDVIKKN